MHRHLKYIENSFRFQMRRVQIEWRNIFKYISMNIYFCVNIFLNQEKKLNQLLGLTCSVQNLATGKALFCAGQWKSPPTDWVLDGPSLTSRHRMNAAFRGKLLTFHPFPHFQILHNWTIVRAMAKSFSSKP